MPGWSAPFTSFKLNTYCVLYLTNTLRVANNCNILREAVVDPVVLSMANPAAHGCVNTDFDWID
jgi:hypothetical protein